MRDFIHNKTQFTVICAIFTALFSLDAHAVSQFFNNTDKASVFAEEKDTETFEAPEIDYIQKYQQIDETSYNLKDAGKIKSHISIGQTEGLDISAIDVKNVAPENKLQSTKADAQLTAYEKLVVDEGFSFDTIGFINAAAANNYTAIQAMLSTGFDIDAANVFGQTATLAAAKQNQLEMLTFLIKNGANALAKNNDNENLISIAASRNNGLLFNIALDYNLPINENNGEGFLPIHYAVQHANVPMTSILIAMKSPLNAKTGYGFTPLLIAVRNNNNILFDKLIDAGADVHAYNLNNENAMILSVVLKQPYMVKRLLGMGGDANMQNKRGWPMVDIALKNKDYKTANLLLAYGAKRAKVLGVGESR